MGETIRWGMIGCGDVAEVKSGPAFRKARDSELVAVMSRSKERAQDYARRHGVPRWHDDADAVLGADDVDAVYVATPTSSHHEYTLRCAAAGKPVYVEKPMAMTHRQCLDMIDACEAAGVPLWVAYYRRALPRLLKVKELVDSGAIGDALLVRSERFEPTPTPEEAAWRLDPAIGGGGIFFEGVCHTLDFLDFLFGPVERVSGEATNEAWPYPGEDTVVASYRFSSGVLGEGSWCFAANFRRQTDEIVGTAGQIRFSIAAPDPIVLTRGEHLEEVRIDDPPHVHQPLVQTIVDELNGSGRCPSTGASAARTGWVTEQILATFRARTGTVDAAS